MSYQLRRAVVIGSGTMGASLAAHLANAGVRVHLLDIVPRDAPAGDRKIRDSISKAGLDRALKSRPASFFTSEIAQRISVGNLEDDLDTVSEADWVIEAIVENLEIKQKLMRDIDELRGPKTIISTNTSGIPIRAIVEGLSESFKAHFLGTHFFNPPRYLKLVELIPGADTSPEVVSFIVSVLERRLGKGVVFCKDTPNFIANRLGIVEGSFIVDYAIEHGYGVKEVDAIAGPPLGRPKTGIFRLVDLVGIDIWGHVVENLRTGVPGDTHAKSVLDSERVTALFSSMLEKELYGNKNQQGFYKTIRKNGSKEFWELNLTNMEYEPPTKPRFESIGQAKDKTSLGERLAILMEAEDRAGDLTRAMVFHGLAYASMMIPEVSDTPKPIDDAMRWGFGHEAGPFEIWDLLGVAETRDKMVEAGYSPAKWVDEMLDRGFPSFYERSGAVNSIYHPAKGSREPLESDPLHISLKKDKDEGCLIDKNQGASLIDLGDGVACVEFHTKMNVIDEDIATMVNFALDRVADDFEGLVVGNEADNFSAGANLFLAVMNAQAGQWQVLEDLVKNGQDLLMRMRYFPKPVITAPAGMALGGGAEMVMSCSRVVAAAELYIGLVEVGVGIIPAWGGTKEMMRRVFNPPMRTPNTLLLPFAQTLLEQIGTAKVATSAEEGRSLGFLGPCDRVVMNRDHVLGEAKREVLHMAAGNYRPPVPERIYAGGRDLNAAIQVALRMYLEGGGITAHDFLVAGKLGHVLAGGELSQPAWVPEQYILDLEREAFLSLCGEEKTQQRMWHTLQTGKPLRN